MGNGTLALGDNIFLNKIFVLYNIYMENTLKQLDEFGFSNYMRIVASKNGVETHATPWIKNKVVLSANNGRNLILQALSGDYTDPMDITHGEIGTGTTAPTDNDTATETPVARAQIAYAGVSGNVLTIKFFISDANLTDDTYTEFTSWINGTATIGTGGLFNRLVFSGTPYVKASDEDSTIEIRCTLTG